MADTALRKYKQSSVRRAERTFCILHQGTCSDFLYLLSLSVIDFCLGLSPGMLKGNTTLMGHHHHEAFSFLHGLVCWRRCMGKEISESVEVTVRWDLAWSSDFSLPVVVKLPRVGSERLK